MSKPDANESIEEIVGRFARDRRDPRDSRDSRDGAARAAVFLDFDGTLAPIVERPEEAAISEKTRASVARLADIDDETCRVAIISGRDLPDVRERVGLEGVAYAGSHGFDIQTADGEVLNPTDADEFLPQLDRAEKRLRERIGDIAGAQIERKRYSLAVHYRRVADPEDVDRIREHVEAVLERPATGLRLTHGKKVFDLQPDIDWHKGRAIESLMAALGLDRPEVVPFYIGDDVTDEDAFRALKDRQETPGVTVVVRGEDDGERERPSAADYQLRDPDGVRRFLDALADHLER